jgi:hypothetical protein
MYITIDSRIPSGASSKSVGDKPVSTETAAIENVRLSLWIRNLGLPPTKLL